MTSPTPPAPGGPDPVELDALARIREVARRITARVRKALGSGTGETDPELYLSPDEGTVKNPEKNPPKPPGSDESTLPPTNPV